MRKVVVVLALLALAVFSTLVYAEQDVFKDSWVHPPDGAAGFNQDGYGPSTMISLHGINTTNLDGTDMAAMGITGPVIDDSSPDYVGDKAAQIIYNLSKESWSGRTVRVNGSGTATINLSGSTFLRFKVRRGDSETADVNISQISMTDANNTVTSQSGIIATSTWGSYSIDLTGLNLSAVNKLFTIIMDQSQNAANGNIIELLLDDVKYEGGNSGIVKVTMTQGVVGVRVTGIVDFDELGSAAIAPNTSLNSASIPTNSHFVVTNIGTSAAIFGLNVVNQGGWTAQEVTQDLASAPNLAQNIYGLYGIFTSEPGSGPSLADYQGASAIGRDVITSLLRDSTSGGVFSNGSGTDGHNVAGGASRDLWIGLRTPSSSTVTQTIQLLVVVTASAL